MLKVSTLQANLARTQIGQYCGPYTVINEGIWLDDSYISIFHRRLSYQYEIAVPVPVKDILLDFRFTYFWLRSK